MVKSKNTVSLTKAELELLIKKIDSMGKQTLRKFRQEFNPDEMGFAEREEGI